MCAVAVWPSGLKCLTHNQKITDSSPTSYQWKRLVNSELGTWLRKEGCGLCPEMQV